MKLDARYALRTVADDPALADAIQALIERVWPAYIQGTSPAGIYTELDWMGVYTRWPDFQFGIFDAVDGRLLAGGNAAPLAYTGALADLPTRAGIGRCTPPPRRPPPALLPLCSVRCRSRWSLTRRGAG